MSLLDAMMGATSPRSPAGQHGRGRNVPHDGQFKVNLPWFNTAEEAPEAAEEFWASPRVDWVRHRWETLDSYSKAKSLAIRREIADVEADTKRVAELSSAMTGWIDSGAPQARIFIQMYHRPGYEGDDAELSHHPDSFARQKLIVNSISTALHTRRLRLEREQSLLIALPAKIAERQVTEMPAIRILTPRTNTVWSLGEMVTITWVSSGAMDQVRIKIATQFGIWQPIADCCENTGQYSWKVDADMQASKWYHIQLIGVRDGREITAATTAFFSINTVKPSSPSRSPVPSEEGPAPSPFKHHTTRQVSFVSLTNSILLDRFDPWEDADPAELLLDELAVLTRPPSTCCLDGRSPIDSILLPSGHGVSFANAMDALQDESLQEQITGVAKLYHSPDHLTGIAPRGDPRTWVSLVVPGERLEPTPGRLKDAFRKVKVPDDAHRLNPTNVARARYAADSMRLWGTPQLSSVVSPDHISDDPLGTPALSAAKPPSSGISGVNHSWAV